MSADGLRVSRLAATYLRGRRPQRRAMAPVPVDSIRVARSVLGAPFRAIDRGVVALATSPVDGCPPFQVARISNATQRSWLSTTNDRGAISTIRFRLTTSRSKGRFGRAVSNATFQPEWYSW